MRNVLLLKEEDADSLKLVQMLADDGGEVNLVLTHDAVYHAIGNSKYSSDVESLMAIGVEIYALHEHVARRGLNNYVVPGSKLIDYDELIDLLFREVQRVLNL